MDTQDPAVDPDSAMANLRERILAQRRTPEFQEKITKDYREAELLQIFAGVCERYRAIDVKEPIELDRLLGVVKAEFESWTQLKD